MLQAETIEEANRRADEVLKLTMQSRLEDKEEVPAATPLNKILLAPDQHTIIANVIMDEKIKLVSKSLTIPEDLNLAAIDAKINFSQVLQRALREEPIIKIDIKNIPSR